MTLIVLVRCIGVFVLLAFLVAALLLAYADSGDDNSLT